MRTSRIDAIALLTTLALASGCWLLDSRPARRTDAAPDPVVRDASVAPLDAPPARPDAVVVDDARALDALALDSGPADSGPACRFVAAGRWSGETIDCTIALDSTQACAEAALCLCRAADITDEIDLLQCVGSELTPRGAITLADYCTESPPPRHTMTEALEGFFSGRGAGELPISAECDSIPALTGPAPWELCAQLASRACPCISASRCPLRSILGVDCLDATRDVVGCVLGRLPVEADDVCAMLDEIVRIRRECEG